MKVSTKGLLIELKPINSVCPKTHQIYKRSQKNIKKIRFV